MITKTDKINKIAKYVKTIEQFDIINKALETLDIIVLDNIVSAKLSALNTVECEYNMLDADTKLNSIVVPRNIEKIILQSSVLTIYCKDITFKINLSSSKFLIDTV